MTLPKLIPHFRDIKVFSMKYIEQLFDIFFVYNVSVHFYNLYNFFMRYFIPEHMMNVLVEFSLQSDNVFCSVYVVSVLYSLFWAYMMVIEPLFFVQNGFHSLSFIK